MLQAKGLTVDVAGQCPQHMIVLLLCQPLIGYSQLPDATPNTVYCYAVIGQQIQVARLTVKLQQQATVTLVLKPPFPTDVREP